jgi:hypothetical protein
MPELTPSELLQIHEMAQASAGEVEKMSAYLSFVQDPELEALLYHHRQKVEAHYQELVDLGRGAPSDRRFERLDGGLTGRGGDGVPRRTAPARAERERGLSDRTIVGDLLQCSKMMTVRAVWAATEISHVGLRRALSEISRYYLDAAYEVYRYMERQGWYTALAAGEKPEAWFRDTHQPLRPEAAETLYS